MFGVYKDSSCDYAFLTKSTIGMTVVSDFISTEKKHSGNASNKSEN